MSNSAPNFHGSSVLCLPQPQSDPHHKVAPMPQSGPLRHKLPTGQPNVHVPSAWNKAIQSAPPAAACPGSGQAMGLPPGSSGYGAQHLHYAAQREHWARMAHCPPLETILLEITAVYEAGGKKRNTRMNIIGVSSSFDG